MEGEHSAALSKTGNPVAFAVSTAAKGEAVKRPQIAVIGSFFRSNNSAPAYAPIASLAAKMMLSTVLANILELSKAAVSR